MSMEPRLAHKTSLRLGGRAIAEIEPESLEDLGMVEAQIKSLGGKPYALGRGSNILASDGDLPFVLVRPANAMAPRIVASQGEQVTVRCGAAVSMPSLLGFCLRNGLSGLEGLVGIPGSVGGSIAMNAGSFGHQVCDRLVSATIFCNGAVWQAERSGLAPGYRKLDLKINGRQIENSFFFVHEATFVLTRKKRNGILSQMRLNLIQKKSRQPVTAWSAGCVFKNPSPDQPAGKLLDAAGFRGKSLGGMTFSGMHANFLVNGGKGSAAAAHELIAQAREAVRKLYGIDLELEVKILAAA